MLASASLGVLKLAIIQSPMRSDSQNLICVHAENCFTVDTVYCTTLNWLPSIYWLYNIMFLLVEVICTGYFGLSPQSYYGQTW